MQYLLLSYCLSNTLCDFYVGVKKGSYVMKAILIFNGKTPSEQEHKQLTQETLIKKSSSFVERNKKKNNSIHLMPSHRYQLHTSFLVFLAKDNFWHLCPVG
jgi:hypothetical protein